MRLALALLCVPTLAHADETDDVIAALAKADARTIAKLAPDGIHLENLWFGSKACGRYQGKAVDTKRSEVIKLVSCIADLGVKTHAGTALPAIVGPGIPLKPVMQDGKLVALWSPAALEPDALTIVTDAFVSHVDHYAPPHAAGPATAEVCVDPKGKVDLVEIATDDRDAISAEIKSWHVKPFALRGKPYRACTVMRVGEATEEMPIDVPGDSKPAPPQNIVPSALETLRVAGSKLITPDAKTKDAIALSGHDKVIGSFKLCIDDTGKVASVSKLKTTGWADYDAKIDRELHAWAYKPYEVNGKPAPVCTAVTFIYQQH
ncbi:MAG: hypothetical protein JO257_34605 [Deltaproteobacteria bacterium]|nr:hypothetical protein [Deltaproteobacteria bacterium]